MKRKRLLFAAIALVAGLLNVNAKTDITSTYLKNANLGTIQENGANGPNAETGWMYGVDGFYYTAWNTSGDANVIEFYHAWSANAGTPIGNTRNFQFYQTVTLPAGYYHLDVNGFYREGNGNGTNTKAFIFAGDIETGEYISQKYMVGLSSAGVGAYTGSNDLLKAANAFSRGDFKNGFDFQLTEETTLDLGFKGYIDTYCSWCILGPVTLYEYTAEDYMSDYTALVGQAEALYDSPMNPTVLAALKAAVVEESTLTTVDDVKNAVSTLQGAINAANASIAVYATANIPAYLAKMKTVLDNTNVYTEDAYNKWYGKVQENFDAGIYTDAEISTLTENGAFFTGWHSANHIDEVLLSTWTIGGAQAADYTTPLYINTWSTEGDTDGSEFHAPFFEYWTGDDQSLGANTLVSTMTGLKPNTTYSFTIRARVRQTNGQTKIANGITMQVGDGTAIDISAGAQFNAGVFFIGNFSAVGTSDDDGNLTTTITVAANSNISWLSFYNCMVTEGEDLSAYISDYEFALGNVNTALTDDVAYAAMQADLQTAATTYAKGNVDETSKADLIAAKEALEAALAAYNAVVAPLKGNSIEGWTITSHETGLFHVNTWSGEGNSDGSNMITPFTEYWRDKNEGTLEDATMSYTVTGLTPGYYKVTALVRSLKETGGTTPEGSFIFANDNIERAYGANAFDCTHGVYGNPVVYGLVGADGNLTIGIKVINANFNWVSWKNFVYEFVGTDLTAEIAANQTEEAREFANENKAKADQADAIAALETLSDANYTAAGQAIEAAYRANDNVVVTIGAAEYTTFVTPYATSTPEGVTAYVVPAVKETSVALSPITTIPANTPVILAGAAGAYEFAVLEGEADAIDVNLLQGSDGTVEGDGSTIYALAKKNDVVGFYPVADGAKVPAGKAYLKVENPEVKGFLALDETTAISNIAAETINGEIFNIAGQKVKNITKGGLYIVNGKKVLVK